MADWQNAPRRYAVVRRPVRTIQINLHPVVAGALALVFIALLAWSGATTSYALFRDEILGQIRDEQHWHGEVIVPLPYEPTIVTL